MISEVKRRIKLQIFRKIWRKKNKNNYTYAKNNYYGTAVHVGNFTYGGIRLLNDVKGKKLFIGNCCSIAEEVLFLLGDDHRTDYLSTFPFVAKIMKSVSTEAVSKGDIIIDDDVWIGQRALILSGVHIGQGAVIAANAVVTHDIPPYAIVGGVPAKVIKLRFAEPVIDYMLTLDYGKLERTMIREHIGNMYKPIDEMPLEKIKVLFDWFPKKG